MTNTVVPTELLALPFALPTPVGDWSLEDVRHHLEYAVNLEIWTIPYYLAAEYSIKDTDHPAFQLIRSVVHQEMLHTQLAANVYNAFQPSKPLRLGPFRYSKVGGVPHLNFGLDPGAEEKYGKPDASLGGLDEVRIGTMCLIELPEDYPPSLDPNADEYASLGAFYTALRYGMQQHEADVRGDYHQVDLFSPFYRDLATTTVTSDGRDGLNQALELVDVITEQGEGRTSTSETIPPAFRNTADGYDTSSSHFEKFNAIRDAMLSGRAPETYPIRLSPPVNGPQSVLAANFARLIGVFQEMFNGQPAGRPPGALMPTVGGNVLSCWRQGVVPEFSPIPGE